MERLWLVVLLFLPVVCFGQYAISGRVINGNDKKPVTDASVFLNNTQLGAKTANDGSFKIDNVKPGQYDLVVSIIGFEILHQNVFANNNIGLADIEITPKAIVLKEVKILSDAERARNYQTFKRLFLGNSPYAEDCKIINPDVIDIDYDKPVLTLTATSGDFIQIQNNALGYSIKYLLANFSNNGKTGILYFEGSAFFEELTGSKHQERVWQRNRLNTFKGSSMDFLRSVIRNDMGNEGFKILRLIRKLNPNYNGDISKKYKETLVTTPLDITDFTKLTDKKGLYALSFDDCLYVMYHKKDKAEKVVNPASLPSDYLNDPVTTTIIFDKPYAIFDTNGIFIDPSSIIFEGRWGESRMAELLPVDYEPLDNQQPKDK